MKVINELELLLTIPLRYNLLLAQALLWAKIKALLFSFHEKSNVSEHLTNYVPKKRKCRVIRQVHFKGVILCMKVVTMGGEMEEDKR